MAMVLAYTERGVNNGRIREDLRIVLAIEAVKHVIWVELREVGSVTAKAAKESEGEGLL